MGEKRYFCSNCNDFVSRGTRSNHLKEMADANETSYDTDNSDLDLDYLFSFCLKYFWPSGDGKASLSLEICKSLASLKEARHVLLFD